MISTFQKYCPDDDDEDGPLGIAYMVGSLVLFYRPAKDIPMSQQDKETAIIRIIKQLMGYFPPTGKDRSRILDSMLAFAYEKNVIRWMVNSIPGKINEDWSDDHGTSTLHQVIKLNMLTKDVGLVELVARKSPDLHKLLDARYHSWYPTSTPTSFAMIQPGMFFPWMWVLRQLKVDQVEFIRAELDIEESPLLKEGWTRETLGRLFNFREEEWGGGQVTIDQVWDAKRACDRCGDWEKYGVGMKMMADLEWRRYIREIRDGVVSEQREGGGEEEVEEVRRWDSLPYRIVCKRGCTDDVCVSGAFDGDVREIPFLPPYPYKDPEVLKMEELKNLTKQMPGAFYD